ncbi:unnamed protein product [Phaeothamnion confervicola]
MRSSVAALVVLTMASPASSFLGPFPGSLVTSFVEPALLASSRASNTCMSVKDGAAESSFQAWRKAWLAGGHGDPTKASKTPTKKGESTPPIWLAAPPDLTPVRSHGGAKEASLPSTAQAATATAAAAAAAAATAAGPSSVAVLSPQTPPPPPPQVAPASEPYDTSGPPPSYDALLASGKIATPDAKRAAARAAISWLRRATNGNGLGVDGTSDTPEFRALWRAHAPTILSLVRGAAPAGVTTGDAELHQMFTEGLMYTLSAKGIVKAVASGDAGAYLAANRVLLRDFPNHDGGVGYIFQGGFFLAAPWPLRNVDAAQAQFEKALAVSPGSRRNAFYVGIAQFTAGRFDDAAASFRRALELQPASDTEADIADWLEREGRKGLAEALACSGDD